MEKTVCFVAGYYKVAPGHVIPLTYAQAEVTLLFEKNGWTVSHYAITSIEHLQRFVPSFTGPTLIYYTGHGSERHDNPPLVVPGDSHDAFDLVQAARDVAKATCKFKLSFILDCCNKTDVSLHTGKGEPFAPTVALQFLNPNQQFVLSLCSGNASTIYGGKSTIFATCFTKAATDFEPTTLIEFVKLFEIIIYKAYQAGDKLPKQKQQQHTILWFNGALVKERLKRPEFKALTHPVQQPRLYVSEKYSETVQRAVIELSTPRVHAPAFDTTLDGSERSFFLDELTVTIEDCDK